MEKLLAVIFFITLTAMLVAARFGLVWASGSGYIEPLAITSEIVEGDVKIERVDKTRAAETDGQIYRGEKISTGDNSRVLLRLGQEIVVALDQRTDVVIQKNTPTEVEIEILRGRLLSAASWETEQLTISTPRIKSIIKDGAITAVRYDFLDKTFLAPLNTHVNVYIENKSLSSINPMEISEIEPFTITPANFNPSASDVIEFYKWTEKFW